MAENKKTLKEKIAGLVDFFTFGVWASDTAKMSKFQRITLALLRTLTAIVDGTLKNRIPIQAASLSYTTLLAIGPIVAVVIIFSGMVFKERGNEFIYGKITDAMVFVMPAVQEAFKYEDSQKVVIDAIGNVQTEATQAVNPKIMEMIKNISESSTSLGIMGSLTVVLTCLLLCVNMESAFNVIWHANKGRSWVMRFTFYWMLITLGVVLGLAGMAFLTGSQLARVLEGVPLLGDTLLKYASWGTQLIGMGALTLALSMFYKFMPNAHVKFGPALIGGAIVTLLLLANNKMSFLYFNKVAQQHTFYGYLAVLPIAMFCLYVFWIFILMGSQITYAIQNLDFLANTEKWKRTGFKVREIIALAVFAEVSKSFYGESAAPTLKELSERLSIPSEIVRASLMILEDKDFVVQIYLEGRDDVAFKPSHAPDTITLSDFVRTLSENDGDRDVEAAIVKHSPAAKYAVDVITRCAESDFSKKTIREICG